MEEASLHTTRKHLFITTYYYDKHGVPPTKRLFKVAMLDPSPNLLVHGERLEIRDYQLCAIWKNLGYSEWSTPAGLKLARENLQSRVKEEDSITDVENAIFDLGVMDSLCFLLVNQRIFISMITKFIKFIELNFSVITRGFDIKVCMLKGPEVLPTESSSTDTPLEQVQNNDEKNVFANERQHSEKHAAECANERVALANLIANLTLDTEENKTILKQLKKANASLTQELEKCKTTLRNTIKWALWELLLSDIVCCQFRTNK
ncbi:hypothetical protein Tco_0536992 [Tanacetum coccineum]